MEPYLIHKAFRIWLILKTLAIVPNTQEKQLKENRRKTTKPLFSIQPGAGNTVFPRIVDCSKQMMHGKSFQRNSRKYKSKIYQNFKTIEERLKKGRNGLENLSIFFA